MKPEFTCYNLFDNLDAIGNKKKVTKCMGHHYAIWASDSNILLALISGTEMSSIFITYHKNIIEFQYLL
jgi:hypothetical protein